MNHKAPPVVGLLGIAGNQSRFITRNTTAVVKLLPPDRTTVSTVRSFADKCDLVIAAVHGIPRAGTTLRDVDKGRLIRMDGRVGISAINRTIEEHYPQQEQSTEYTAKAPPITTLGDAFEFLKKNPPQTEPDEPEQEVSVDGPFDLNQFQRQVPVQWVASFLSGHRMYTDPDRPAEPDGTIEHRQFQMRYNYRLLGAASPGDVLLLEYGRQGTPDESERHLFNQARIRYAERLGYQIELHIYTDYALFKVTDQKVSPTQSLHTHPVHDARNLAYCRYQAIEASKDATQARWPHPAPLKTPQTNTPEETSVVPEQETVTVQETAPATTVTPDPTPEPSPVPVPVLKLDTIEERQFWMRVFQSLFTGENGESASQGADQAVQLYRQRTA